MNKDKCLWISPVTAAPRAGQFDPETYPATIAALRSQNSLASPPSSA